MLLTKHHGLGNDFLVALSRTNPTRPGGLEPDPELAARLCDRHFGLGADGLLWGLPPSGTGDLRMVLHNSDGSEAEISGNGIRCLAQAHLRSLGVAWGTVTIETPAGVRTLECEATSDVDRIQVSVDMGVVGAGPEIPGNVRSEVASRFGDRFISRSIGNPHLVIGVESLDGIDIATVGRQLEASFSDGINVHLFEQLGVDHLRVVHWERGAGVTLACGSGASVTAEAAHRWGLVGAECLLDLPGGQARVQVGETVVLTGPAQYVADVVIP